MTSVLVVSPPPSVPGGVTVFIECMKRHVTRSVISSFFVGSEPGAEASAWSTFIRLFIAPIKLAQYVRTLKPDVVHLNPSFDTKSLIRDGLFLIALRLLGYTRILVFFHGWDFKVHSFVRDHGVTRFIARSVLNRATKVTVLAEPFRQGLIALGVDGTRVELTQTMFEGAALRNVAPVVNAAGRSILFMSRFDREKGGRELLEAFASLASDYPDLKLYFAGSGPEATYLKEKAAAADNPARIIILDYVTGHTKWKLLSECTIFALPTYYRSEGMPVAVLEAMGAGKPLLVGSAGALPTIVTNPDNGVILTCISPENIAKGLRQLLDNPNQSARMGAQNAKLAWARFEAVTVTQKIEDMYDQVAAC